MEFLNLYQLNITYFIIFFFIIVLSINLASVKLITKKKIYDINEKNNNKLIYTGFGFFVIITLIYLSLFLFFSDQSTFYYHVKYLQFSFNYTDW